MFASPATISTANDATRASSAPLSSSQAFGRLIRESLTSNTIRPWEAPSAAPISTTTSPFFEPPAPGSSPVARAASPRLIATRSIAAQTRSSKLRPLRVPASSASSRASRPCSMPEASAIVVISSSSFASSFSSRAS